MVYTRAISMSALRVLQPRASRVNRRGSASSTAHSGSPLLPLRGKAANAQDRAVFARNTRKPVIASLDVSAPTYAGLTEDELFRLSRKLEREMLIPKPVRFPIKEDTLILLCKACLACKSGLERPEMLAEDFKFVVRSASYCPVCFDLLSV